MIALRTPRLIPEEVGTRPALALRSSPGLIGTTMTKMTYREQLLHPHWQRKRLERLSAANWKCDNCGDEGTTLQVHHRQYFKGRLAWEYEDDELAVLCQPCHEAEHTDLELLKALLVRVNTAEAFAVLCGYHRGNETVDPGLLESGRQGYRVAYAAGVVANLAMHLDIDKMAELASHALTLSDRRSLHEAFEHRGDTFGEDAPEQDA